MRVVITGANGQLGRSLQSVCAALQQQPGFEHLESAHLIPIDLPEWDISDPRQVPRVADLKAEMIIHCAAMTDVDGCAADPDEAFRVNALGAQNVAQACLRNDSAMVYVSTNEVFDGTASRPYTESDETHPINSYGASKLAGEKAAASLLRRLYIVRISWLFAPHSNNFVSKILARAGQHGQLQVVTDEVANPTYAPDLALALWKLVGTGQYGVYHLVNEGPCSRYEFALEILRQAGREHIPVTPITSDQYRRASTPPAYAPLRNTVGAALGIRLRPWPETLQDYFRA